MYIKLTTESCTTRGLKLQDGLITDPLPWNVGTEGSAGGLHFTTVEYMSQWLVPADPYMFYVWDVEIAPGARFIHYETQSKASRIILSRRRTIWDEIATWTEIEKIAAVRHNAWAVRWVRDPSEAVQLEAVTQSCWTIEWISNPTERVQLEAVEKNGLTIELIGNPSAAVVSAAAAETVQKVRVSYASRIKHSRGERADVDVERVDIDVDNIPAGIDLDGIALEITRAPARRGRWTIRRI